MLARDKIIEIKVIEVNSIIQSIEAVILKDRDHMQIKRKYIYIFLGIWALTTILYFTLCKIASEQAMLIFNKAMSTQKVLRGSVTLETLDADIWGRVEFKNLVWLDTKGQPVIHVPQGRFKVRPLDIITGSIDTETLKYLELDNALFAVRFNNKMQLDIFEQEHAQKSIEYAEWEAERLNTTLAQETNGALPQKTWEKRANEQHMPRETAINEEARLTVGKHINKYIPSWNVEKIVNWGRIKGGNIDDEGEQWLCVVKDDISIAEYGRRDKIWTLPSAYEVADAVRWGTNQIQQYKNPIKSAKVSGIRLDYPLVDGTFNVRHMTTKGQAQIRTLSGDTHEYPITKVKYTISASGGIAADLELGEPVFSLEKYLSDIERNAQNIEQSQSSAIKQLTGI